MWGMQHTRKFSNNYINISTHGFIKSFNTVFIYLRAYTCTVYIYYGIHMRFFFFFLKNSCKSQDICILFDLSYLFIHYAFQNIMLKIFLCITILMVSGNIKRRASRLHILYDFQYIEIIKIRN